MAATKLVLDIGNTRTKLGLFENKMLLEQAIWVDWSLEDLLSFIHRHQVQQLIVSSVAEKNPDLIPVLSRDLEVLELTHHTPLPFENTYKTPETLGKDRVAAVAGAQELFPQRNCLVVDCGTCIKYELLESGGVYRGGNIAPGLHMRIRAMHHFTARLPEVTMELPENALGSSTETALQNGALLGAIMEIRAFFNSMQALYSDLQLVLTGGDASFLKTHLEAEQPVLEPTLTLFGLNAILDFNTETK
jgi:type III pantothenate kinase